MASRPRGGRARKAGRDLAAKASRAAKNIRADTRTLASKPDSSGGSHPQGRARAHVAEAIDVLVELMRHGGTDQARRAAAEALIERGWGRADGGAGEVAPLVIVEVVTGIEPR